MTHRRRLFTVLWTAPRATPAQPYFSHVKPQASHNSYVRLSPAGIVGPGWPLFTQRRNFCDRKTVAARLSIPDDGLHGSVTVMEWYKEEGEYVEEQEALCEIETPDFTYDFQSDVSGYLARILVRHGPAEAGETIGVLL